ncbi:MAG: alpha/beta fold hydrolase [Phycisphaerales bacterium]|nr:alpha/beta fold hydrolase [Phycisphaerales bacterium]
MRNWLAGAIHRGAMRAVYLAGGFRHRLITVDGDRWPMIQAGRSDGVPSLFLHGFATSKDAMLLTMSWRAPWQRVIAIDLPGFGEHDLPAGAVPSPQYYLEGIEGLRKQLGIARWDLVGTSMGGSLAAAYAAEFPSRVNRLVLLAPAGVRPGRVNAFMQGIEAGVNPLDFASLSDLDRMLKLAFARPPFVPGFFRRSLVSDATRRREATADIIEGMREFLLDGVRGALPRIRARTLVVWGDADQLTDISMCDTFAELLPDCRCVRIPGAGHVVFADAPREVREALSNFFTAP